MIELADIKLRSAVVERIYASGSDSVFWRTAGPDAHADRATLLKIVEGQLALLEEARDVTDRASKLFEELLHGAVRPLGWMADARALLRKLEDPE